MRLARIRGHVTSTVRHPSLAGQRLLVAQPEDADGRPVGDPQVVLDTQGAGCGARVLISSDGDYARQMTGDTHSPARFWVVGMIDPPATA